MSVQDYEIKQYRQLTAWIFKLELKFSSIVILSRFGLIISNMVCKELRKKHILKIYHK